MSRHAWTSLCWYLRRRNGTWDMRDGRRETIEIDGEGQGGRCDSDTYDTVELAPLVAHGFSARPTCLAGAELPEVLGCAGDDVSVEEELDAA